MIDLRFIERSVPAPELGEDVGRIVRILQVRRQENAIEVGIQAPIFGEWEDVRLEDETI